MRYAAARLIESERETAYRIYITDGMYYQAQQKYQTVRYMDIIGYREDTLDKRSGDEIARDIIESAGLRWSE